ncbi:MULTISPECIES: hypothetical protein [unclassified Bradyrhizobium]|uniref:hypothetical protein n=1 Tax=unclassified Bradyrhizobium TaxID=2631580 RepID=UPI001FFA93DD|nr:MULTISPECIES: hypothetical protein [unclassified Bradyrhizobium]MCK1291978.1 hypothetical protein [Bradyrhizobium sp. 30]MCK1342256.1 hypothetical protein [Bradyrhizobium sp. CW11]
MSSKVGAQVPPRIALVYLARFAEGVEPVRKFIESYKRHPAGVPHDLIIVWKGFPNNGPADSPQMAICREVEHRSIAMTDEGLDLTAYDIATAQIDHEFVCFLNTFSEIESDNWMQKLYAHISRPDVGIVGSTASFESLRLSMKGMNKAVWMCVQNIPYDPFYADVWGQEIVKHAPRWLTHARGRRWRRIVYKVTGWRQKHPLRYHISFEHAWNIAGEAYAGFPEFPNPHLRSNAFMIRRTVFRSLMPFRIYTKNDAFNFESGKASMTNQILRRTLKALVVGHDGKAYDLPEWKDSFTFRRGSQHNKLVADNQTKAFDTMNRAQKILAESWTWGPPLEELIIDIPELETITTHRSPSPDGPLNLPNAHLPLPFSPELFQ